MARWIGIGLEGTLSHHDESRGGNIGPPLHPMVNIVRALLSEKIPVKIFTPKVADSDQRSQLEAWLKRHRLEGCGMTDTIDDECHLLIDARTVRADWNEGDFCGGCRQEALRLLRSAGLKGWPRASGQGFMEFC